MNEQTNQNHTRAPKYHFKDQLVQMAQLIVDLTMRPGKVATFPQEHPHHWSIIQDCLLVASKSELIPRSSQAKTNRKRILREKLTGQDMLYFVEMCLKDMDLFSLRFDTKHRQVRSRCDK